jgi:peptide chain release factor 3
LSLGLSPDPADLAREVGRRRVFAIIAHPDAGKTTLTEQILRAAGAIQLAGQVRAKGERRRTRSDWMAIERARGISVVTSVMTFPHDGLVMTLLDTPGHEDFSEDTYRTLTAVDCAVMVIDAAKGIEAQTRKLFEICRLRDIPIITFINKMDRESRDPFALLDEIGGELALDTAPLYWPVGRADRFTGLLPLAAAPLAETPPLPCDEAALAAAREEEALAEAALPPFAESAFHAGHLTPVVFGAALKGIGVAELLALIARHAPPPRPSQAESRRVDPREPAFSAYVFKIQANMDPQHRDRIAFARICSGRLTRGMKIFHVRTGRFLTLAAPQFFFARERSLAEEAYAGDVIGIPSHGGIAIGDTFSLGEPLRFLGVPAFAPEILRRVRLEDAMKAKKLRQALLELAEEGVVQVFRPHDGSPAIVGVVGALQLDVLSHRLGEEYGVTIGFDPSPFALARWVSGPRAALEDFIARHRSAVAEDHLGRLVFLAPSLFQLNRAIERESALRFTDVAESAALQPAA